MTTQTTDTDDADTNPNEYSHDPNMFADNDGDALLDLSHGRILHMADEHRAWDTGFGHQFITYGEYHHKLKNGGESIMKFRDARESDVFLPALAFTHTGGWGLDSLTRNGEATWTSSAGSVSRRHDEASIQVERSGDMWEVSRSGWIPGKYDSPYWDTSVVQTFYKQTVAYAYAVGLMVAHSGYEVITVDDMNPEYVESALKVLNLSFDELDDVSGVTELTRYETRTERVFTDVIEVLEQPGDGPNLIRTLHKVTDGVSSDGKSSEIWYTAPEFNREVLMGAWKVQE